MCILIYGDLCFELWSLYFHAHYNAYLNISLCLASVLLVMTFIWLLGSICQLLARPMGGEREKEREGEREGREEGREKERKRLRLEGKEGRKEGREEEKHTFIITGHGIWRKNLK